MKTIILVVALSVFAFSVGKAQKSSKSKVSISYSGDNPKDTNYKANISVSDTEDTYSLNANFPNSKTEKLKQFLKDHLTPEIAKDGTGYTWKYKVKGETGYAVTLKKGRLNVFMNKEFLPADFIEDFIDMFTDLKDIVKE